MTNSLNNSMGFSKNPFSKFSAEEEFDFHSEIFYKPHFYDTLLEDLKSGTSRFILGQRGHGKSSVIHQLKLDLEKENIFTLIIDRFDDIQIEDNKIDLLNLILTEYVSNLCIFLHKNKKLVKKLDKESKEVLLLLIKLFFKPLTHTEYVNKYNSIKHIKFKNWIKKTLNRFIHPTNQIINTGILITSSWVTETLGLGQFNNYIFKDYVSKATEFDPSKTKETEDYLKKNKRSLKELLNKANKIALKIHFKSSVILFDKVDEFQKLDQDIHKISTFTEDILTDTELLLQNDIAIAFSLWSEIRPILSRKVRFDKFKEIDISWKKSDMLPLINKRVSYFTSNRNSLSDLIVSKIDLDQIIKVSNNSPRDFISCMSHIYDYQTDNPKASKFESSSIANGIIKFSKTFDYYSLYPSRTGKSKDVISMINRLLKIRKIQISVKDFMDTFNQKTKWGQNSIEIMLKYKLLKQDERLGHNEERIYNIMDPKIIFLISRGVDSLD